MKASESNQLLEEHTHIHTLLDTTKFKVSHYMLDLCRVSSLLSTLLCSLICILKCHLVFPLYCRLQEEATTWVDEQVIGSLSLCCHTFATVLQNWLALMIFSKERNGKASKLKKQSCPKSWRTFLLWVEIYQWCQSRWLQLSKRKHLPSAVHCWFALWWLDLSACRHCNRKCKITTIHHTYLFFYLYRNW